MTPSFTIWSVRFAINIMCRNYANSMSISRHDLLRSCQRHGFPEAYCISNSNNTFFFIVTNKIKSSSSSYFSRHSNLFKSVSVLFTQVTTYFTKNSLLLLAKSFNISSIQFDRGNTILLKEILNIRMQSL